MTQHFVRLEAMGEETTARAVTVAPMLRRSARMERLRRGRTRLLVAHGLLCMGLGAGLTLAALWWASRPASTTVLCETTSGPSGCVPRPDDTWPAWRSVR